MDWIFFLQLFGYYFAVQSFLMVCKSTYFTLTYYLYFAIQYKITGPSTQCRHDFRKLFGDQFLSPRPDKQFALPFDKLPTDSIPFVFDLPSINITQFGRLFFKRVGKTEWIGFRELCIGIRSADELVKFYFIHLPVAHYAVRDYVGINRVMFGDCIDECFGRYANAETSSQ